MKIEITRSVRTALSVLAAVNAGEFNCEKPSLPLIGNLVEIHVSDLKKTPENGDRRDVGFRRGSKSVRGPLAVVSLEMRNDNWCPIRVAFDADDRRDGLYEYRLTDAETHKINMRCS